MALKQGKKRVSIHGMATNGIIAQHSGGKYKKSLHNTTRHYHCFSLADIP